MTHPEFDFVQSIKQVGADAFLVHVRPVARAPRISIKDAAKILDKSPATVLAYIKEGLLTSRQVKARAKHTLDRSEVEELASRESA